jgi:hypothetical protein
MKRNVIVGAFVVLTAVALIGQEERPLSPSGSASAQVLGHWVKADQRLSTMTGEAYEGGKWIDITYGRPLKRGRDPFGPQASYGKQTVAGAPVWRAGANVTTRLKTEVPLLIGGKTVAAGEYSVLVDLKQPSEWTLIVSSWPAQPGPHYDRNNKAALWGAFGYTPDRDVARVPMQVDTLPYSVEELTWQFLNMTNDGGTIALVWDKSMGSVSFKVAN